MKAKKPSKKILQAIRDAGLKFGTFKKDFLVDGKHYKYGAWNTAGDYWYSWNTPKEFWAQYRQDQLIEKN